jgi:hypothetical protein
MGYDRTKGQFRAEPVVVERGWVSKVQRKAFVLSTDGYPPTFGFGIRASQPTVLLGA